MDFNNKIRCFLIICCGINYAAPYGVRTSQYQLQHQHEPQAHIVLNKNILQNISIQQLVHIKNAKTITVASSELEEIRSTWFGHDSVTSFIDLEKFNFTNNQIKQIGPAWFNHAPNLQTLDLSMNQISRIHEQAFVGLSFLIVLDLSHNLLITYNTNVFAPLRSMVILNLADNQLTTLDLNAFNENKGLKILLLARNSIAEILPTSQDLSISQLFLRENKLIEIAALENLKNLTVLDISLNQIRYLNFTFSKNHRLDVKAIFPNIKAFHKANNLFDCDYEREIVKKLHDSNVTSGEYVKVYCDEEDQMQENEGNPPNEPAGQFYGLPTFQQIDISQGPTKPQNQLLSQISSPTKPTLDDNSQISQPASSSNSAQQSEPNRNCGKPSVKYNVGSKSTQGMWPWLVPIYRQVPGTLSMICSGTQISSSLVLTTASCTEFPESQMSLAISRSDLFDWTSTRTKTVGAKQYIRHPDYTKKLDADLALIVLTKPTTFDEFTQPICFDSIPGELDEKQNFYVGWIRDELLSIEFGEPGVFEIPLIPHEECVASTNASVITERSFCGGKSENWRGPCNIDDGGALVVEQNGQWFINGIFTSSAEDKGIRFCNLKRINNFARIASFKDWIKKNVDIYG